MRKFCPKCTEEIETALGVCPVCGSELVPIGEDNLVGRTLDDKYAILQVLGKGGMGIVYRARQKYLEREVALKVLRRGMSSEPGAVKRFMLEARAASGLKSPHTVTIHDFGVTREGLLYFTMELLEGQPLNRIIAKEKTLKPERAVNIVVQTCASLAEAHEKGIWHRDLKPENIFITKDPQGGEQVRVLDFGIAKVGATNEKLTATGVVCGTPMYLSPEQAQGRAVDQRTDIYSLGIVLYEMLAGRPPFTSSTPMNVLLHHINDAVPPVSLFNPDVEVPEAVHRVLMQALQKRPEDRPATAQDLAGLLVEALGQHQKKPSTTKITAMNTSQTGLRAVHTQALDPAAVAVPKTAHGPPAPASIGRPAVAEGAEMPGCEAVSGEAPTTMAPGPDQSTDSAQMVVPQAAPEAKAKAMSAADAQELPWDGLAAPGTGSRVSRFTDSEPGRRGRRLAVAVAAGLIVALAGGGFLLVKFGSRENPESGVVTQPRDSGGAQNAGKGVEGTGVPAQPPAVAPTPVVVPKAEVARSGDAVPRVIPDRPKPLARLLSSVRAWLAEEKLRLARERKDAVAGAGSAVEFASPPIPAKPTEPVEEKPPLPPGTETARVEKHTPADKPMEHAAQPGEAPAGDTGTTGAKTGSGGSATADDEFVTVPTEKKPAQPTGDDFITVPGKTDGPQNK